MSNIINVNGKVAVKGTFTLDQLSTDPKFEQVINETCKINGIEDYKCVLRRVVINIDGNGYQGRDVANNYIKTPDGKRIYLKDRSGFIPVVNYHYGYMDIILPAEYFSGEEVALNMHLEVV